MTIKIPVPSSMLIANLLGVLGLIAVVVAVGGLAGLWWSVLAGGVFAVGLSVVAATNMVAEQSSAAPATSLHVAEERQAS